MRGGTTHLLSCVCQLARVTVAAPRAHHIVKASSLRPAPTTASSSDSLLRGDSLGGGSGGGWCGLLLRLVQGWAAWGGGGGSGMGGGGHSGARGLANGGGGWLTAGLGGPPRAVGPGGFWWLRLQRHPASPLPSDGLSSTYAASRWQIGGFWNFRASCWGLPAASTVVASEPRGGGPMRVVLPSGAVAGGPAVPAGGLAGLVLGLAVRDALLADSGGGAVGVPGAMRAVPRP